MADPIPDDVEGDDDDDWEGWAEPEVAPTRDLFSERVFESAAECLSHAKTHHNLDLAAVASRFARRARTNRLVGIAHGNPLF